LRTSSEACFLTEQQVDTVPLFHAALYSSLKGMLVLCFDYSGWYAS
jgi:hypothetical protein